MRKTMQLKIITLILLLAGMCIIKPCMAQKGGKMEILELNGSYFEIGEQWGKAFNSNLQKFMDMEIEGLAQYFGLEPAAVVSLASKFLSNAKTYDPEFMDVLTGFSKSSGIAFEKIFAIRCLLELSFFIQQIPEMCTSFAVTGSATKNGNTIIGQNIDWHPGIPMKMLKINWPNGVSQLSLSVGGIWEYSLTSHSSSSPFGIAANATVAYREGQNIDKTPLSIVMNKASRQKRMGEALSVFIEAKKDLGSFLMASAEGDMLGMECVADDVEILYPQKNTLVRANHYLTDRFKQYEFFSSYVPDSYLRYARLKRLIQENRGEMTPKMMMGFLADHNGFPKSICTHVDPESVLPPSASIASIVMIPKEKTMYVAFGNPCETEYVKYTMD